HRAGQGAERRRVRPRRRHDLSGAAPARDRRAPYKLVEGRRRAAAARLPGDAHRTSGALGSRAGLEPLRRGGRRGARVSYLDELGGALGRVGIRGALRARILAEAADHLAQSDPARFGRPDELAQRFADELATAGSTRTAFRAFAALGVAGAAFAAGWLLIIPAGGWPEFRSAPSLPLGLVAGLGMLICPQVSFAAGLLAVLRAVRIRRERSAAAADVAVLVRRPAAAGPAGDMFDDLSVTLPRRPWAACLALASGVAVLAFAAGGLDEGPRNAVGEFVLVVACFAVFGRRLALRD